MQKVVGSSPIIRLLFSSFSLCPDPLGTGEADAVTTTPASQPDLPSRRATECISLVAGVPAAPLRPGLSVQPSTSSFLLPLPVQHWLPRGTRIGPGSSRVGWGLFFRPLR